MTRQQYIIQIIKKWNEEVAESLSDLHGCQLIRCPEDLTIHCEECPFRNFWEEEAANETDN